MGKNQVGDAFERFIDGHRQFFTDCCYFSPSLIQMLNLHYSVSPPPIASSSLYSNKHRRSVSFCGYRLWQSDELKKIRRIGGFDSVNAMDRDSEFEIDTDKAREALRKLDEQMQSLSQKKIDPPKIRASSFDRASREMNEETTDFLSGSFLGYAASALILFTIFYNVIFLTVIKPSIDQPETVLATTTPDEPEEPELSQLLGVF